MRLWTQLAAVVALSGSLVAFGQEEKPSPLEIELYGFAMADSGYDFGTNDQAWYDVVRPTKLPSVEGEFGEGGRFFIGVRQSRLGIKAKTGSPIGDIKVHLEAELFGTGDDAGRTMFRLRHAFGEVAGWGAGQTWSSFMDPDVFPNSVEYWGPSGMVFFRNVQLRWRPYETETSHFQITLENPGGSADVEQFSERVELEDITPRFPAPDVAARFRYGGGFGHVQLAGIFRYLRWDDAGTDAVDLSGSAVGWGVNLSSNIKLGELATFRLQAVYGQAIENYMNDASVDIAAQPGGAGLEGVPLKTLGTVAFVDVNLGKMMSVTAGHSYHWVDNAAGQSASAFHASHYALANVMFKPAPEWMLGPELQWGQRQNNSDGFTYNTVRIQFSAKYSFSTTFKKE